MEFRKPSAKVAREARKLVEQEGRKSVADFGAEIVKAFQSGDDDDKAVRRAAALAKAQEYNPGNFDRERLLAGTIKAWSYGAPVNADTIADLDEETARWAHQHVVGLMKPPTQEASKSTTATASPGA